MGPSNLFALKSLTTDTKEEYAAWASLHALVVRAASASSLAIDLAMRLHILRWHQASSTLLARAFAHTAEPANAGSFGRSGGRRLCSSNSWRRPSTYLPCRRKSSKRKNVKGSRKPPKRKENSCQDVILRYCLISTSNTLHPQQNGTTRTRKYPLKHNGP